MRSEKGLSIQEVADATRISQSNLQAIENQEFDALPADTFTRGLVTIYATFLGLNGNEMATRFLQDRDNDQRASGRRAKSKTTQILKPKTLAEPAHISSATIAGIILLILILLLTGFCLYTSWNPFAFLTANRPENMQGVMKSVFPENGQPPGKPQQQAMGQGKEEAPAAQEKNPAATKETGGNTVPASPATSPASQTLEGYILSVRFLQDTWVEVAIDDAEPIRMNYKKDDIQVWTAEKAIKVSFGQPNSAILKLNGAEIPFPEAVNGKVSLQLPEDLLDH